MPNTEKGTTNGRGDGSRLPQEINRQERLFGRTRRQIYRIQLVSLLLLLLLALGLFLAFSIVIRHNTSIHVASIGSCQVFPANNIWNYDISHLPVDRNSANYIKTIGTDKLQNDFGVHFPGFPYVVVPGTQPYVPVQFRYTNQSDPGPYPIPPNAPIENRSDRHVMVVDSATCKLYEMFASYPQADGSWEAGSGAIWNLNSNALRPNGWTSADAAGLPILPGLVRYDEVAAGAITHALRFAVSNPQNTYVWPARHSDGPSHNPNSLPEGLRLRLKASVDISSFPPQARVILMALKYYGMFLADNGGDFNLALSGAPDQHWREDDLAILSKIHGSDFEVVDESSLQVSPDSGMVSSAWQATTLSGNSVQTNSWFDNFQVGFGNSVLSWSYMADETSKRDKRCASATPRAV